MRFLATLLLWLVTTAALAIAVPVTWAQHSVVSRSGYTTLATKAAKEPSLQGAVAGELATQLNVLATKAGYSTSIAALSSAADSYTGSAAFPGQFAAVNGLAHDWLFTDTAARTDSSGHWLVDLSPMLSDSSLKATLAGFGVQAPSKLQVPVTDSAGLRPGQFRVATTWGPWAGVGACVLAGLLALLTLGVARSRGKTLAALGISVLLIGAAGWAGIEVAPAARQRCPEPHQRQYAPGCRRHGGLRDRRHAPLAEHDAGRGPGSGRARCLGDAAGQHRPSSGA